MPKPGRPPDSGFQPSDQDRYVVECMAQIGTPQDQMVHAIINPGTGKPIALKTLRKCFRMELDRGEVVANSRVAGALFKAAVIDGNVRAQIFWLQARAKWAIPQQLPQDDEPDQTYLPNQEDTTDIYRRVLFLLELKARKKLPSSL